MKANQHLLFTLSICLLFAAVSCSQGRRMRITNPSTASPVPVDPIDFDDSIPGDTTGGTNTGGGTNSVAAPRCTLSIADNEVVVGDLVQMTLNSQSQDLTAATIDGVNVLNNLSRTVTATMVGTYTINATVTNSGGTGSCSNSYRVSSNTTQPTAPTCSLTMQPSAVTIGTPVVATLNSPNYSAAFINDVNVSNSGLQLSIPTPQAGNFVVDGFVQSGGLEGYCSANYTVQAAAPPATYSLGGNMSGLPVNQEATLINLEDGETVRVTANSSFQFGADYLQGDAYNVAVESTSQPAQINHGNKKITNNIVSCSIQNGTGTFAASNANVNASCKLVPDLSWSADFTDKEVSFSWQTGPEISHFELYYLRSLTSSWQTSWHAVDTSIAASTTSHTFEATQSKCYRFKFVAVLNDNTKIVTKPGNFKFQNTNCPSNYSVLPD